MCLRDADALLLLPAFHGIPRGHLESLVSRCFSLSRHLVTASTGGILYCGGVVSTTGHGSPYKNRSKADVDEFESVQLHIQACYTITRQSLPHVSRTTSCTKRYLRAPLIAIMHPSIITPSQPSNPSHIIKRRAIRMHNIHHFFILIEAFPFFVGKAFTSDSQQHAIL